VPRKKIKTGDQAASLLTLMIFKRVMRQAAQADGAEPVGVSFPVVKFEIFNVISVRFAPAHRIKGIVIYYNFDLMLIQLGQQFVGREPIQFP